MDSNGNGNHDRNKKKEHTCKFSWFSEGLLLHGSGILTCVSRQPGSSGFLHFFAGDVGCCPLIISLSFINSVQHTASLDDDLMVCLM